MGERPEGPEPRGRVVSLRDMRTLGEISEEINGQMGSAGRVEKMGGGVLEEKGVYALEWHGGV